MHIHAETLSFSEEAEVLMQDLAEFLARDTRVNLLLVGGAHDQGMVLTPGAFLMLAIPLIEAARLQGDDEAGLLTDAIAPDVARESIRRILETMKDEPAPADSRLDASGVTTVAVQRSSGVFRSVKRTTTLGPRDRVRSSLSVIAAYWKRFCSIPPFCEDAGAVAGRSTAQPNQSSDASQSA